VLYFLAGTAAVLPPEMKNTIAIILAAEGLDATKGIESTKMWAHAKIHGETFDLLNRTDLNAILSDVYIICNTWRSSAK
jgi:hypothetical protein